MRPEPPQSTRSWYTLAKGMLGMREFADTGLDATEASEAVHIQD